MAMTRANFDIAKDKGEIGEGIVRGYLEKAGWVVYQPMTQGAHCFDMMCIKDKRSSVAFDIKAKARMNAWAATGVNQRHFDEYKAFSDKHNMPFWIVFVDEGMAQVYGNTLDELEKPRTVDGNDYPMIKKFTGQPLIRLWPLFAMKVIQNLTADEAAALARLNQRSYAFEAKP